MATMTEFASAVQSVLEGPLGAGCAAVEFKGIDPENMANGLLEVSVSMKFGLEAALPTEMIEKSSEAELEEGSRSIAAGVLRELAPAMMEAAQAMMVMDAALLVEEPADDQG